MQRHFNSEEIKDYVFREKGEVIREELGDNRRWLQGVETTFKTEEGEFYIASWDRGLTENQDNEFYDQTLEQVFPLSTVVANVTTVFSPDPLEDTQFSLDKETLQASTFISNDAEKGLTAIQEFDTSTVLEFLKTADAAILGKNERAFLEASRQFFSAVENIQKEL